MTFPSGFFRSRAEGRPAPWAALLFWKRSFSWKGSGVERQGIAGFVWILLAVGLAATAVYALAYYLITR